MNTETVSEIVIDLVEREIDDDTRVVSLDSRLREDLEVDSLSMAAIAVDLEDRFSIRFDMADLARMETIRDVVTLIAASPVGVREHAPAPDAVG